MVPEWDVQGVNYELGGESGFVRYDFKVSSQQRPARWSFSKIPEGAARIDKTPLDYDTLRSFTCLNTAEQCTVGAPRDPGLVLVVSVEEARAAKA